MTNLNILETFRTKEELVNYFKSMGKNITEEEIENLKKSYNQVEEVGNTLSLEQLNNIAGGTVSIRRKNGKFRSARITPFYAKKRLRKHNCTAYIKAASTGGHAMEVILEPQRGQSHITIRQSDDTQGIIVENRNLSPVEEQDLIRSAGKILQSISRRANNDSRFNQAFNDFILRNPKI